MKSIKMIVTDLDGTLLRSDKTISEPTIAVLEQCRRSGIKLVYATGRSGESASIVAPSDLFHGRVSQNGAVIATGNQIIRKYFIPYETARPLLMACDKNGLKTASQAGAMHYSNFLVSDEWPVITNFMIVDFSKHEINSEKIYAIIRKPEDALFIESVLPNDLYLSVSSDGLGMIMHKDATKAKAAACLAGIWDISQSEVLAFGDDFNDLDMLQYAGIGVAMGNAADAVKAAADYICLTNDDDGLAEWIISNINKP